MAIHIDRPFINLIVEPLEQYSGVGKIMRGG
jgi:hypothetical protein